MRIRAQAGNLTAALVVVSLAELVVNRLVNRLFVARSAASGDSARGLGMRLLSESGPFLFHLTGTLGLLVMLLALVGLLRRAELFTRPFRATVTVIGIVFWILALLAISFGHLPSRFFIYLQISFGFLSAFVTLSLFAAPAARLRQRLGVLLFAAPGMLHVAAIVCDRMGWLRGGALEPSDLSDVGELALLAAAVASPLLLLPRPTTLRRVVAGALVAGTLSLAFVAALFTRFDVVQAAALYTVRLELAPGLSLMGLAYPFALFGWAFTTFQLLAVRGGSRLAGYGLCLLAIAGYQLPSPVELSLGLVGLLSLAVGMLRAAVAGEERGTPLEQWRAFVGQLAAAVADPDDPEAPQAVIVDEGDREVSQISARRDGRPVGVRLLRRRGHMVELEATVGEPGRREPDATIERHRSWMARSPEQKLALPKVKTGDPAFDKAMSVRGHAPLGDPELRRRLMSYGDGITSLWRGHAARYSAGFSPRAAKPEERPFDGATSPDAQVASVIEIVDTLGQLVTADPPPSA